MHIVGHHQAGDLFLGYDALGQRQNFFGGGGVQSGGVLVQQQELGGDKGSHKQGKRLPLPAGEQPHRLLHAVLQPHVQQGKLFAEERLILAGDAGEDGVGRSACPQVSQRQIFLDGHVGCGALERVLEQMPDDLAALVLRRKGDVLPAQQNAALVGDKAAGDGVEQGGFARAVGAHDGGKISGLHLQAYPIQRHLFVDGAGVKGLVQVVQLQHFHVTVPPCWSRCGGHGRRADAFQRRSAPGWRAWRWPLPR